MAHRTASNELDNLPRIFRNCIVASMTDNVKQCQNIQSNTTSAAMKMTN